jgi:hypothetical protein
MKAAIPTAEQIPLGKRTSSPSQDFVEVVVEMLGDVGRIGQLQHFHIGGHRLGSHLFILLSLRSHED